MKVAVIDSGIGEHDASAHQNFTENEGSHPHGAACAALIKRACPPVSFLDARVFGSDLVTTASRVADAVHWAIDQKANIINLSLGLREDRLVLSAAIAAAIAAKIIVVAPSPARGGAVYPAAYAGVVRATGDARCGDDEFSWLEDNPLLIGACPRSADDLLHIGGASFAAARVSGALAMIGALEDPLAVLRSRARFRGRERR